LEMCYMSVWLCGIKNREVRYGHPSCNQNKTHHTWTLTSCNGTPWISVGFYMHLIFRDFTHPVRWNTVSPQPVLGQFLQHVPHKVPIQHTQLVHDLFQRISFNYCCLIHKQILQFCCILCYFATQTRTQAFLDISPI
jgi:hypothetical protein